MSVSRWSKPVTLLVLAAGLMAQAEARAGIVVVGKCHMRMSAYQVYQYGSSSLKKFELPNTGTLANWITLADAYVLNAAKENLRVLAVAFEKQHATRAPHFSYPECTFSLMPEATPTALEKLRLMDLIQYFEGRLYSLTVPRSVGGGSITPYLPVRFVPTGGF